MADAPQGAWRGLAEVAPPGASDFVKKPPVTALVSLSSGEAELYGVVKGASEALGMQSIAADLGINAQVHIKTDSSAAIGICSRQGLGRLRHIDTHTLWIQQAVRSKRIAVKKIDGAKNPA